MKQKWRIYLVLLLLMGVGVSKRPLQAAGVVGNGTSASCTETALRTAVSGGGVVTFNCGGPKTIILQQHTQITIYADTIIDGGGQITLSGDNATRLFYVSIIGNLTVRNITLTNGYANGYGGAVYISDGANFTAENSNIQNSQTNGWAGSAIFAEGQAEIVLHNCIVQNNKTSSYGAINSTGPVTIVDSLLQYNDSDAGGGAMSVGGNVTIQNSQISWNNFNSIDVTGEGAGIYATATSYVLIENTVISENVAWDDGGGIYTAGEMLIRNSIIYENDANDDGGGIFLVETSAYVTIENSLISQNVALDDGGGIAILGGGEAIIYQSTVLNNLAEDRGGGVYVSDLDSIARFNKSTLSYNSAGVNGGGVQVLGGTATFNNVTISKNSAQNGGGISSFNGSETLTQVTMNANSAYASGGAGNLNLAGSATVTTRNSIFNIPRQGANCVLLDASVLISNGFNLSSDNSCSTFLNAGGDINNQSAQLGDLADNGGATLTHMPLTGSPAIDGGTCLGANQMVDQRNEPRPAGNACDIGAVERQPNDGRYFVYLPLVIK